MLRVPALSGIGGSHVDADVTKVEGAAGVVVFAHGSGSNRGSPRNQAVAREFQRAGLGTVLVDLLTVEEQRVDDVTRDLRFDIPLLSSRVVATIDQLPEGPPIGLFGASTGAAAALVAAAQRPDRVAAVVSRGGRPDLAGAALAEVQAPVLLVVGGADREVLELNRAAEKRLRTASSLQVVPGATHLFEEPGAMDRVSELAIAWFVRAFRYAAAASA